MTRSIYLIDHQNALTELREQPYDSEALLQQLLADHPGVLAGNAGGTVDQRWLLVTREASVPDEFGVSRWAVDHLFLDQDAVPTLVEVKRSTDTRIRREVVGQMLDYAANAVAYWPIDRLRAAFEARCAKEKLSAAEQLADVINGSALDESTFWQRAKTNLQAGRIRLVFVADAIPRELQRVVEFLNEQMDPAEVLALEVRQYVADGMRTLVPTLLGQTAEAQQRKGTTGLTVQSQWDEEKFLQHLASGSAGATEPVARELLEWSKDRADDVWWGRGQTMGSFVPVVTQHNRKYQLFAVYSLGVIEFYFQWLSGKPGFTDEKLLLELLGRLNAIPGVAMPPNALKRRPSVPLSVFSAATARTQLFATLDWLVSSIRSFEPEDSILNPA